MIGLEVTMSEAVEGGAALAWRLLATLEGGSLVLAASALLAYTTRRATPRAARSVLITNTTNPLGEELKKQLESRGCTVSTVTSGATSVATSGEETKVDALVVVGAEPRAEGLDGMSQLVSEDVYNNLKVLDTLSSRVRSGGYIAWACAGAASGSFGPAAAAFDDALRASLHHVAHTCHCKPVWVGRCETVKLVAERLVEQLVPQSTAHPFPNVFVRNAANRVTGFVGRWLKIIT